MATESRWRPERFVLSTRDNRRAEWRAFDCLCADPKRNKKIISNQDRRPWHENTSGTSSGRSLAALYLDFSFALLPLSNDRYLWNIRAHGSQYTWDKVRDSKAAGLCFLGALLRVRRSRTASELHRVFSGGSSIPGLLQLQCRASSVAW